MSARKYRTDKLCYRKVKYLIQLGLKLKLYQLYYSKQLRKYPILVCSGARNEFSGDILNSGKV